ncbi:BTB/POZ domain-containing protein At4g08455-like, partial [Phalaenopsis equestris]
MRMWCQSCREEYKEKDAGTCKECYEEASETEEELKREIEDLKAKVAFLRLSPPVDSHFANSNADLLLHGVSESQDGANAALTPAVPAHRAVL